ncbi:MAG: response regulator transcription factor [Lachnospiraceae bacterium]|nr:response regulator transcription factor [Lachnospiraceae bacterium]
MRVAVCEDERSAQELLKKYLAEWAMQKQIPMQCSSFDNAESFLFDWEEDKNFDLLILDIEMGALNGMELAEKLRSRKEEIPILFVTGYEQYMSQGYEVAALHYLLKPLHKEKLFSVLDRLQTGNKAIEKLVIETEEETFLMPCSDIWYLEAQLHKSMLFTKKGIYRLRSNFSKAAAMLLEKNEFVQCHRSFVVNMQHLSAITKTELLLDDMTRIPISRSMQKAVQEAFKRNYGVLDLRKGEME